jgi:glycosyltransferase involved in cell wall biosynthesis
MKILLTSNRFYPDIGGIETISEILAHDFSSKGHAVLLITQSQGDGLADQKFPFRILRKPMAWQLFASYRWADVVLQNNLEIRQLWPMLVCRKPLVIGLQTWIRTVDGRRTILQQIKLIALRTGNQLIACSNAVRLDCSPRAAVIGNPYNSALFRHVPGVERRQKIVFLGRLVSDKGADMLIKAFAGLKSSQWRLSMIGDGPERAALQRLAAELGIAERVDFLGALKGTALVSALNEHEVMVVPSRWREPFGVVALEGLACGCIVLASDGGGLPDAVGTAGVLFRRGDQSDLQYQLNLLLLDEPRRQQLRARATDHLQAFQQEVVCNHYLSVLKMVAAEPDAYLTNSAS